MSENKVYMLPNLVTPNKPVVFNDKVCDGCNRCVQICPMDVLYPNPTKGQSPVVLYPEECWYCGSCIMECHLGEKGALQVKWPLANQMRWKRKATGEDFRVGMASPPPPNKTPPVGGWHPKF